MKINHSVIARRCKRRGNPVLSGLLRRAKAALLAMTIIFAFTPMVLAAEQVTYPFTSKTDSQRFIALTNEIRCPVCQGQSIADSNAPLANDLRNKVYQLILEKKSDADVRNYLTQRYGNFILLRPPINQSTWLLWIFPMLAMLAIPLFIIRKNR